MTMTTRWKLIDAAKNINTFSPSPLSLWNHENNNNNHHHHHHQQQHYHNYVVCPTTDVYRKFAVSITTTTTTELNRVFRILEIGCCTGQTTELFIKGGKIQQENILALDISSTFIEQCQMKFNNDNNDNNNNNNNNKHNKHNNIQFEQIDVLLEWARLEEIIRTKWGSKNEQRKNNKNSNENENEEQQSNKSAATDSSSHPKNYNINNDDLLEHQMNTKNQDDEDNEELIVFIDIGGNREIESVLAIIQAFLFLPMRRKDKNKNKQQFDQPSSSSTTKKSITTSLLNKQPMIMVVKSQALYDYGVIHGPDSLNDWDTLQNLIQKQLLQRRRIQRQHKQGPSKENDVQQDSATTEKEQQQASQKSQWRYYRHPLKMPQRYIITPGEGEGGDDVVTTGNNNKRRIAICRYHNYDKQNGCLLYNDPNKIRGKKVCLLDHDHCHYCLKRGHIALDCPMLLE